MKPPKTLSEGQRAYEAKRAAKAGVTLDKWLHSKQRQQEAETRAKAEGHRGGKATEEAGPAVPPAGPRAQAALRHVAGAPRNNRRTRRLER